MANQSGWKTYTLKDAYAPREPKIYLVDGIAALPSLNVFYGSPGDLKTMLLMDMKLHIAAGMDWLPPEPGCNEEDFVHPIKVIQAPAMHVDLDIGIGMSLERFEALGRGLNLPDDLPMYFYSMPNPMLNMLSTPSYDIYKEKIIKHKAKTVTVDNLGLVKGKAKENDDGMIEVMSNFRAIAENFVIDQDIVHHQRKSPVSGKDESRKGETLRGFGGIEAALDFAILVDRIGTTNVLHVQSTKTRGDALLPFGAKFVFTHKKGTHELETAKFYGVPVEDKDRRIKISAIVVRVLKKNEKDGLNKKELAGKVAQEGQMGTNMVERGIDAMADDGYFIITPGPRTSKIYRLDPEHDANAPLYNPFS